MLRGPLQCGLLQGSMLLFAAGLACGAARNAGGHNVLLSVVGLFGGADCGEGNSAVLLAVGFFADAGPENVDIFNNKGEARSHRLC